MNFVTKMAVYQPRRAAIATILVTVMQDDNCEELLGCHKRGRTKEWIWRRAYYSTSRCLCFLDFFAFLTLFVQIIAMLFFTERWQCGSHIALSPLWLPLLTEKLSCTIIRSVKRKKTIMNYHVEFEHVQTA